MRIQEDIANRVKAQVETNQREYYLREQVKAIHRELGEDDSESDADKYTESLDKLKALKKLRKNWLKKYAGLSLQVQVLLKMLL